jgi:hypothetical protein
MSPTFKKCLLDDPVVTVRAPYDLTSSLRGLDYKPHGLFVTLDNQRVPLRCIAPGAPCVIPCETDAECVQRHRRRGVAAWRTLHVGPIVRADDDQLGHDDDQR